MRTIVQAIIVLILVTIGVKGKATDIIPFPTHEFSCKSFMVQGSKKPFKNIRFVLIGKETSVRAAAVKYAIKYSISGLYSTTINSKEKRFNRILVTDRDPLTTPDDGVKTQFELCEELTTGDKK